jgi:predicted DCC family thiol-disulfide oxidoreductase YuxK
MASRATASDAAPAVAATAVVLFDGHCGLCRGGVRFLLKRDPETRLRFGAMQAPEGRALIVAHGLDPDDLTSFVVIDEGRAMRRSTAALHLSRFMPWPWPLLRHALWLPRPLRDFLYDLVAWTRFWFFRRYESCYVPTAAERARFI